ncbi:Exodeoxyribonuclease V beta chain [Pseudoalteromonas luteoviolacea B = ATCC 29581]|nr:Exodeoxyribonuclease V beta chain [Pseudoalteromonas luteoviolacea B = ATCC 29581]
MKVLNPQTMPLNGHALIEASAGTGKTYTITGLYLRYLLGLYGDTTTLQSPLSIDQILVVTFTEAATQEIKDRVRSRIVLARNVLLGESSNDELITHLLALIEDKQKAYDLLDAAAKSMDEAAIFTIHGFCQRMLKQHAFESNMTFNQNFVLDQSEMLEQAVYDFWRQFVYPLNRNRTNAVLSHFSHPLALAKAITPYIMHGSLCLEPVVELDEVFSALDEYQQGAPGFKEKMRQSGYISAIEDSDINGSKTPKHKASLTALKAYLNSNDWWFEFGQQKRSFEVWGSESINDPSIYKKVFNTFEHELTKQFDYFAKLHEQVKHQLPIGIMQKAVKEIRKNLDIHKETHSILTPDDLLNKLFIALQHDNKQKLITNIVQQYPVALIDEFQDTDPIQYGIFSTIYERMDEQVSLPQLTMIGDPKQAIYGFRGADIFTYIRAKRQINTDRQFTLNTNYRSDDTVVEAVNTVFSRHGQSFVFDSDIPFSKVLAKGKPSDKQLKILGSKPKPLSFAVFDGDAPITSKSTALSSLAQYFASQIAELLAKAKAGEALIADQPILASDICILVRDRNEAAAMKTALNGVGVSSVYLSRDSVFSQPLCSQIYQFLNVLHGQYDERLLRGVLAGPLFGVAHHTLFELQQDERQWQEYLDKLYRLKALWDKQGVMAMFDALLIDNDLPTRWQAASLNIERMLTDYRHLAEILQQKQLELDGTFRVLRWLNAQLLQPSNEGTQLRLESDADLVKIVTMHASKGLEYPIVYLPFATTFRLSHEAKFNRNGQTVVDMSRSEEALESAEKERLAEDIRLLYVALTRAVHHCAIGLFNVADGRKKSQAITKTALGYVLFGAVEYDSKDAWMTQLDTFCEQNLFDYTTFKDIQERLPVNELEKTFIEKQVKRFEHPLERDWKATSFSQLSYHSSSDERPLGAIDENHLLDLPAQLSEIKNAYTFPKGAKAGSCLHEIFELIDFKAPTVATDDKRTLRDAIEFVFEKYHIDLEWLNETERWITACLKAPLFENTLGTLSLSQLSQSQCLVEMEFNLPLSPLNASQLNKLLSEFTGHVTQLRFDQVQGLLKGFIDLIFEWQGRYYVLDYKSNYLGDTAKDYQLDNLETVMSSHQYHLQYVIYTVALHRLLRARLTDYDPNHHLGGALYLFLRGLPDGQGVYFRKMTQSELNAFDALFDNNKQEVN